MAAHPMRRLAMRPTARRCQRGVAIITALLLTTLAVTIVASLFWQQQVQVRSMENQRLQLQTRWILRGALDWTRLILSQDARDNQLRTTLDGVWATPLAETRLDQYIERERVENEKFDATLSGQITDAQSRYNLANLAKGRQIDPKQKAIFEKLLTNLQLDAALAQRVAQQVADGQALAPQLQQSGGQQPGGQTGGQQPGGVAGGQGGQQQQQQPVATSGSAGEPIEVMRVEDLLAVSGFTPQAVERLRDFVIVLPAAAALNVNTAPPELLSAAVDGLSLSEATTIAANRKRTSYLSMAEFTSLLNGRAPFDASQLAIRSNYFLVLSRVKLDRATLNSQALLQRGDQGNNYRTVVVWIRDN
jgi:general secretion pathway protein K